GGSIPRVPAEAAVVFLNVAHPELFALEIECLDDPGPCHRPDGAAVSHRRRRRHVLLLLAMVPAAERALPQHRAALAVDAPEKQIVAVALLQVLGDIEEHPIAPDDGRRTRPGWKVERPGDVLGFRPSDRQIFFAGGSV